MCSVFRKGRFHLRSILRNSLFLISRRGRIFVYFSILLQILLALLDLVGIGLVAGSAILAVKLLGTSNAITETGLVYKVLTGFSDDLRHSIFILVIVAISLFVLKTILSAWLLNKQLNYLAARDLEISEKAIKLFLNRDLVSGKNFSSQELISAMTAGSWRASSEIIGNFIVLFSESSLLAVIIIFLFFFDVKLTFLAILYFFFVFFILHSLIGNRLKIESSNSVSSNLAQLNSIQTMISAAREIKVLDRSVFFADHFMQARIRYSRSSVSVLYLMVLPKMLIEVSMILGIFLIAILQFIKSDVVSAASTLALYLTAGLRILPSLLRLQNSTSAFIAAIPGARLFFDVFPNFYSVDEISPTHIHKEKINGSVKIELKNVDYVYGQSSMPALRNVSVQIPAGSSCVITGDSGSGKSTLVDLILGVIQPSQGSVSYQIPQLDDISIQSINVGYVSQNVAIIRGSIRENIAFGLVCSDSEIWRALDLAGLKNFVLSLPEGLESSLLESEVNLSGGQIQRIAVARAVLNNPSLIILDEASSGLDLKSHLQLISEVLNLKNKATTIFVSHNWAGLEMFDQIIFIKDGMKFFSGTYQEFKKTIL
jgi:ABC-type multidrug transport system fused ATPase/permease subunit